MSSLSLSILILSVAVALVIAAQSAWVLLKDRKKKLAQIEPEAFAEPTSTLVPMAGAMHQVETPIGQETLAPKTPEPPIEFSKLQEQESWKALQGVGASAERDLFDNADQPASELGRPMSEGVESRGKSQTHSPEPSFATPLFAGNKVADVGPRVLHDDADFLIELKLVQMSSGDRLIGLTKSIRRAGGKPVGFEGLSVLGHWEGLRYGVNYQSLRAGILLANRQGPLNAMEFSEFSSKLQGLTAQLGVPLDLPEMHGLMQRARSLDALLSDSDVQLGLSVDCSQALSQGDLANLAKRLNLHERGNTRYACLSEAAEVIYSVALGDKTQRLQLMFDVPRVDPAHKPWWKMAEAAHQAAVLFDGKIIDDNGRELSEQSFRTVAIALEGRQQALSEAGVPAGSPLAMRVFN